MPLALAHWQETVGIHRISGYGNGAVARAVSHCLSLEAIYRSKPKPAPAEDSPLLKLAPNENEARSPMRLP